ncbi:unnamed protein product [Brassica rapa subsp. narinosa]
MKYVTKRINERSRLSMYSKRFRFLDLGSTLKKSTLLMSNINTKPCKIHRGV